MTRALLHTFFCLFLLSSFLESRAQTADIKPTNIVFLLDVSNSMGHDKKMDLLRKSAEELCKVLNTRDRISLLTFGSVVETLYTTTSFPGPDSLLKVLGRVRSTASATNVNRGIYDAYELASSMKLPSGNHVLLITDGEFVLNPFTKNLVEKEQGIRLTCVIVGTGLSAEKAVKYVTEELKLSVITLVHQDKDVKKLAGLVRTEIINVQ